jgi:hypothetical protein
MVAKGCTWGSHRLFMSPFDSWLSTLLENIHTITFDILSDGEDAELLVYLVKEDEDIYIGVLVLVCHLASRAQPSWVPRLLRCRRLSTN